MSCRSVDFVLILFILNTLIFPFLSCTDVLQVSRLCSLSLYTQHSYFPFLFSCAVPCRSVAIVLIIFISSTFPTSLSWIVRFAIIHQTWLSFFLMSVTFLLSLSWVSAHSSHSKNVSHEISEAEMNDGLQGEHLTEHLLNLIRKKTHVH